MWSEAKLFLRKTVPLSRQGLGAEHAVTLMLSYLEANAIGASSDSVDDLIFAHEIFERVSRIQKRVLGPSHPMTVECVKKGAFCKEKLDMVRAGEW